MNTMAKSMKTIETMGRNAHEIFQPHYSTNCMFQLQNATNSKGKCPRLKTGKTTKSVPKRCVSFNYLFIVKNLELHREGLQLHKKGMQLHRDKPSIKLRKNKSKSLKSMFFWGPKKFMCLVLTSTNLFQLYVFALTSSFSLSWQQL